MEKIGNAIGTTVVSGMIAGTLMLIPGCTADMYIKDNNRIDTAYTKSFVVLSVALGCTELFFERKPFYGTHNDCFRHAFKILFCSLGGTVIGTGIGYGIPQLFDKKSLGFLFGSAAIAGYCGFVKSSGYKIF
jgi:hypothetical protein